MSRFMVSVSWMSIVAALLGFTARPASAIEVRISREAASAVEVRLKLEGPRIDESYKRNRIMQSMGIAMMGAAVLMISGGAGMVQGSPYGPTARTGIIAFGVGLTHFVAAAFLLGFSKSIIRQKLAPVRSIRELRKTSAYRHSRGDIYF